MHPTVRILSIGDELMLGRVTDTNASFLCRLATDRGFRVLGAQQVGDGEIGITAALLAAAQDADLVLVSGGLGPTDDDRTRHALAAALGVPLAEHALSWSAIEARYRRLAPTRVIPPNNRRQALLPRGARPLANDRGTAPGMVATLTLRSTFRKRTLIAVFPGVPHEMKAMAERFSATLPRRFPGLTVPLISEVWFAGIGESAAQERLGDLLSESAPQVGITVSELGHLTLRVVGGPREVAARTRALRACLKGLLLPAAGLAPSLIAALTKRRATITAAESCTGGHVAALLTAVPGASAVLRESLVAYHPSVKHARLDVPLSVMSEDGIVSEACVRAMAVGAQARSGATFAVATTGVAGPTGGSVQNPVGTVWLAVATAAGSGTRKVFIQGIRERIQARAATSALQLAWDALHGQVTLD